MQAAHASSCVCRRQFVSEGMALTEAGIHVLRGRRPAHGALGERLVEHDGATLGRRVRYRRHRATGEKKRTETWAEEESEHQPGVVRQHRNTAGR